MIRALTSTILISLVLLTNSEILYAAPSPPTPVAPTSKSGAGKSVTDVKGVPNISDIAEPAIRAFNMLTLAAGVVFMIMIFYSAYKYSLAQGDPKGLEGAKQTLTYAIFGFIVTIGAFALITIIANIFNIDTAIIKNPGGASKSAIQDLMDFLTK